MSSPTFGLAATASPRSSPSEGTGKEGPKGSGEKRPGQDLA